MIPPIEDQFLGIVVMGAKSDSRVQMLFAIVRVGHAHPYLLSPVSRFMSCACVCLSLPSIPCHVFCLVDCLRCTAQVPGNVSDVVVFGAVSLSLLEPTCVVPIFLFCTFVAPMRNQLGLSQVTDGGDRGIVPPPERAVVPPSCITAHTCDDAVCCKEESVRPLCFIFVSCLFVSFCVFVSVCLCVCVSLCTVRPSSTCVFVQEVS
jgi:hypothetical protein